jgi:hypothetical protein
MGHYEILAQLNYSKLELYFLVHVGGSSGYDHDLYHDNLLKLNKTHAKPFNNILFEIQKKDWTTITSVKKYDDYSVQTVISNSFDPKVYHN